MGRMSLYTRNQECSSQLSHFGCWGFCEKTTLSSREEKQGERQAQRTGGSFIKPERKTWRF